jgi:Ca2+-binding EF-hand superfamily protein
MIDFTTEDRKQYKEVFDALDSDGSKAITIKELEEPLIALGFVSSREKVAELVKEVDEDGSGKIEFDEFLLIMRSIKKGKGQSSLFDFFDDMIKGKLSRMGDMDAEMPFMLNISMYRRRRIMDAIMSDNEQKKKSGQKIMNVSY